MNEELKKKYYDFAEDHIEKYYNVEDRNYTAEEYEKVFWEFYYFFEKPYKGQLNNCYRQITKNFIVLIDDSLKSDDPNFIQNKINKNTKKYRLLMQEKFKERVEEVLKEKLLEKYEDAINGKVTDDDLGSLNFIEPELYKPLDTSS